MATIVPLKLRVTVDCAQASADMRDVHARLAAVWLARHLEMEEPASIEVSRAR